MDPRPCAANGQGPSPLTWSLWDVPCTRFSCPSWPSRMPHKPHNPHNHFHQFWATIQEEDDLASQNLLCPCSPCKPGIETPHWSAEGCSSGVDGFPVVLGHLAGISLHHCYACQGSKHAEWSKLGTKGSRQVLGARLQGWMNQGLPSPCPPHPKTHKHKSPDLQPSPGRCG